MKALAAIPTGWYGVRMPEASSSDQRPGSVLAPPDTRTRLLDATVALVREKGWAATSVDEICRRAGVTKGAFFHHFRSKEDLAIAAAEYWSDFADVIFAAAPYHALSDPLDRVRGYLAFRRGMMAGDIAGFTCFVGTMVQEAYAKSDAIRAACEKSITSHAATLEEDILAAMRARGFGDAAAARDLALHTQAVLQGAFILAKATGDPDVAARSVDHLDRYIEFIVKRGETP